MTMKYFMSAACAATLLAACATSQENPNYQYSSKYKEKAHATTSYANYSQPAAPILTQPQAKALAPTTEPVTPPTDQLYAGQDTVGTPGYEALHGNQPVAIAEAPTQDQEVMTISGPIHVASTETAQSVEYDYSDNIVSANTPAAIVPLPETRTYTPDTEEYVVQQGDTVYSISRRLCVGVHEIQSANNLSANYAIQIGQSLSLPESRC